VGHLIIQKPRKLKSNITNCFFILLSLAYPLLSPAQNKELSFASPSSSQATTLATITHITCGSDDSRVFLNWAVSANEQTDQFEIERSTDGKHFTIAALFFGSDKRGADHYEFFEKKRTHTTYYRVRIIRKDHSADYSPVIVSRK
jgi:hypothetical protein